MENAKQSINKVKTGYKTVEIVSHTIASDQKPGAE